MPFTTNDPRINRSGRPRGAQDKLRTKMLARICEQSAEGKQLLPLEYMLQVLNDPKSSKGDRQWAANAAAPYIHRRMPIGIEGGDPKRPIVLATAQQLHRLSDLDLGHLMGIVTQLMEPEEAEREGFVIEHESPLLLPSSLRSDSGKPRGRLKPNGIPRVTRR